MTQKQITLKYRITHNINKHGDFLIFSARDDAEEWLRLTELDLPIEEVAGTIKEVFQPTAFHGCGIYGRYVKRWQPLA